MLRLIVSVIDPTVTLDEMIEPPEPDPEANVI
jgi:hypothetical protein